MTATTTYVKSIAAAHFYLLQMSRAELGLLGQLHIWIELIGSSNRATDSKPEENKGGDHRDKLIKVRFNGDPPVHRYLR